MYSAFLFWGDFNYGIAAGGLTCRGFCRWSLSSVCRDALIMTTLAVLMSVRAFLLSSLVGARADGLLSAPRRSSAYYYYPGISTRSARTLYSRRAGTAAVRNTTVRDGRAYRRNARSAACAVCETDACEIVSIGLNVSRLSERCRSSAYRGAGSN